MKYILILLLIGTASAIDHYVCDNNDCTYTNRKPKSIPFIDKLKTYISNKSSRPTHTPMNYEDKILSSSKICGCTDNEVLPPQMYLIHSSNVSICCDPSYLQCTELNLSREDDKCSYKCRVVNTCT